VTIYCATTNAGKIAEFRLVSEFVSRDAFTIEPLPGLHTLPQCEETGSTFEENAIQKALCFGAPSTGLVFAEDSGLEVDSLGGEPGVYSARYAGPGATDAANNALLLSRLGDSLNRSARFVCVIALARGGSLIQTFRGSVEGEILTSARGEHGFGYDPLFYYPPFGCSFGEIPREQKQTVSHRGAALKQLAAFVKQSAL
jgi:XTP/dITP diphosphohydrolase